MSENMTNENIANGNDKVVDEPEQVVSPDMLYKLSKKIGKDFPNFKILIFISK